MITATKKGTSDDLFLCELYLYDYDAWLEQFHDKYVWDNEREFLLTLAAAEAHQIEVIHYFEKLGMMIEPPDFWETEGRLTRLIDQGEWVCQSYGNAI